MDQGLREAKKKLTNFKRNVSGGVKEVGGGLLSSFASGAGMGAGMLSFQGLAGAVGDVAAETYNLEKGLTRFSISGDATAKQMERMRENLVETAKFTGISKEELLSASAAYVAFTGDSQGAIDNVALFGKVANATGTDLQSIGQMAGSLQKNLHISAADMGKAFGAIHAHGKMGSAEMNELASLLPKIAPAMAQFANGGGGAGVSTLSAALQTVRGETGSTEEAITRLKGLSNQLVQQAGKLKTFKINVFEKDRNGVKKLRDFRSIVQDIANSKLAKDPQLMAKVFGQAEAREGLNALVKNLGLFKDLIAKGDVGESILDADQNKQLDSAAGTMAKAMQEMKASIAEAFTPERIKAFADALMRVANLLSKIFGFVEGIGAATGRFVSSFSSVTPGEDGVTMTTPEFTKLQKRANSGDLTPAKINSYLASGTLDPRQQESLKFGVQLRQHAQDLQKTPMDWMRDISSGKRSTPPIEVRIGANAVGKTIDNATKARVRPGG